MIEEKINPTVEEVEKEPVENEENDIVEEIKTIDEVQNQIFENVQKEIKETFVTKDELRNEVLKAMNSINKNNRVKVPLKKEEVTPQNSDKMINEKRWDSFFKK